MVGLWCQGGEDILLVFFFFSFFQSQTFEPKINTIISSSEFKSIVNIISEQHHLKKKIPTYNWYRSHPFPVLFMRLSQSLFSFYPETLILSSHWLTQRQSPGLTYGFVIQLCAQGCCMTNGNLHCSVCFRSTSDSLMQVPISQGERAKFQVPQKCHGCGCDCMVPFFTSGHVPPPLSPHAATLQHPGNPTFTIMKIIPD